MDIKGFVEKAVEKIKGDPKLLENFTKEPIKTIEGILGIDLPDEIIEQVATAVKGKIKLDGAADVLGKLGKLF